MQFVLYLYRILYYNEWDTNIRVIPHFNYCVQSLYIVTFMFLLYMLDTGIVLYFH